MRNLDQRAADRRACGEEVEIKFICGPNPRSVLCVLVALPGPGDARFRVLHAFDASDVQVDFCLGDVQDESYVRLSYVFKPEGIHSRGRVRWFVRTLFGRCVRQTFDGLTGDYEIIMVVRLEQGAEFLSEMASNRDFFRATEGRLLAGDYSDGVVPPYCLDYDLYKADGADPSEKEGDAPDPGQASV